MYHIYFKKTDTALGKWISTLAFATMATAFILTGIYLEWMPKNGTLIISFFIILGLIIINAITWIVLMVFWMQKKIGFNYCIQKSVILFSNIPIGILIAIYLINFL